MLKLPYTKDKLVPLRRFTCDELYSAAYLSQLVQRGKLKAQKIGRNFCTTREWFEEYLEIHALDETRDAYKALFHKVDLEQARIEGEVKGAIQNSQIKVKYNLNIVKKAAIVVTIAAFIIVGTALYLVPKINDKQGTVAGEKETATSTKGVTGSLLDSSNPVTPDAQIYYEKD